MRRHLHCKNMLTLRLDIANDIFSPRRCIVYISSVPCGQCDTGQCDNKPPPAIAPPNTQKYYKITFIIYNIINLQFHYFYAL